MHEGDRLVWGRRKGLPFFEVVVLVGDDRVDTEDPCIPQQERRHGIRPPFLPLSFVFLQRSSGIFISCKEV